MDIAIKSTFRRLGTASSFAVLPLALPLVALVLFRRLAPWQSMWLLAFSIYFSLKWLTFISRDASRAASIGKAWAYLMLWPGMNAKAFFRAAKVVKPTAGEWLSAFCKLTLGLALLFVSTPFLGDGPSLAAAWTGMIGLILVLHFGVFHISSLCFRLAGIDAQPIMRAPLLASSLGDLWGRRWNLGFRDLAHAYVFRPIVGRIGGAAATMIVFLVSGLIHDLVISIPAQAGYGGPTAYFVLQGFGLLFERSRAGQRLGLANGIAGRLFCALVAIGPVRLLFHDAFVRRIIVPTLLALAPA